MTPIDYARDMVNITSPRKLLYNCIFSKYKMEQDDDNGYKRKLHAQVRLYMLFLHWLKLNRLFFPFILIKVFLKAIYAHQ